MATGGSSDEGDYLSRTTQLSMKRNRRGLGQGCHRDNEGNDPTRAICKDMEFSSQSGNRRRQRFFRGTPAWSEKRTQDGGHGRGQKLERRGRREGFISARVLKPAEERELLSKSIESMAT